VSTDTRRYSRVVVVVTDAPEQAAPGVGAVAHVGDERWSLNYGSSRGTIR
jgi:hypothetical protein